MVQSAGLSRADYVQAVGNVLYNWTIPTKWYRDFAFILGAQQHVGSLHPYAAPEMPHDAFGLLCDRYNMDVVIVGGAWAERVNLLIGISAQERRRAGRG